MTDPSKAAATDRLYAQATDQIAPFAFDEKVAEVFPDMIRRSVPGYSTIIANTGVIAGQYAQENSYCYDLGCSLGAGIWAMAHCVDKTNCQFIGVDNSESMIQRCQNSLSRHHHDKAIHFFLADITEFPLQPASVIAMNFTLQFIEQKQRLLLLKRCYDALLPGGILLLSEKIQEQDSNRQQRLTQLYHDFKQANGYSQLEISQKRTALENVLIPETAQTHYQRLTEAGFQTIDMWYRCFTFSSILAYK